MYFYPLNIIRFGLAAGVLLFHYGTAYYPFNIPILKTIIEHSSFRVSFFFFISGFVMCLVYAKQGENLLTRDFYIKRFTRIFPVYWLAFIATLILVIFVNHASPKGLVIILHFLGLQSLNPGYVLDLNFTAWSISVDLVFYLLFPLLLKWLLKIPDSKIFGVTIIVWLVQTLQHIFFVENIGGSGKVAQEFVDSFALWHLPTFFVGMVSARLIIAENLPETFKRYATFYFMLSVLFFIYLVLIPNPILKYVHNGLLSPVFAVFVMTLFYDKSGIAKFLSLKPLSRLGDLSFGIFIYQYPVWLVCSYLFTQEFKQTSWFFTIYCGSLLIFCWMANLFFEKPILDFLRLNLRKEPIKT